VLLLRILDKYLLRELSGPFVFGITLFAALMIGTILLSDVLRTLQKYDLSLWLIVKYMALSAPQFLVLCIPMGALLGTLIAVGRLNSDHEIVAIRAAGFSLYRVLVPFLIVGVLLAGATMVAGERIVPLSRQALLEMKNDLRAGKYGGRQEQVTIPIMDGQEMRWLLVAGSMEGTLLRNTVLLYFDPRNRQNDAIMRATEGRWGGGNWEFENMQLSQMGSGEGTQLGRFESSSVQMPDFDISPAELDAKRLSSDDVSARQLREFIDEKLQRDSEIRIDPTSGEALQDLHDEIREQAAPPRSKESTRIIVPFFERGDLVWAVIAEAAEEDELRDVRIFHIDKRDRDQNYAVYAARAKWLGGRRGWAFYEMRKVLIDPADDEEPLISLVKVGTLPDFKLSPRELDLRSRALEDMNSEQLRAAIAQLRVSGGEVDKRALRSMQTELVFKYAIPLTPVFFIWIAFPLAIMPQRSSNTRGMGIALLIILVYMASVALFRSLGTAGVIWPPLAAWIPNLALALVGWRLMQKRQNS
jgi:lipopolysaccharide export system permease protein